MIEPKKRAIARIKLEPAQQIQLESLQKAFANVYETMDTIDNFKLQALNTMSATIGTLEAEVTKSKEYLERVANSEARMRVATLEVPELKN